jgi:peptide/nickel transport system ATP-binding protein
MFDGQASNEEPLLEVSDLAMEYNVQGKRFFAISDVNMSIKKGETLGLVGESGCGKSTMGRAIIQLPGPTTGSVKFLGREITGLSHTEMRSIRKSMQIIFQDH